MGESAAFSAFHVGVGKMRANIASTGWTGRKIRKSQRNGLCEGERVTRTYERMVARTEARRCSELSRTVRMILAVGYAAWSSGAKSTHGVSVTACGDTCQDEMAESINVPMLLDVSQLSTLDQRACVLTMQ